MRRWRPPKLPVVSLAARCWLTAQSLPTDRVLHHGVSEMTGPSALVWFKRDLRVRDHAPLAEAMQFENALGLVMIEPQWLSSPECDPRHVRFLLDCVTGLQRSLATLGLPLLVRTGAMLQVLQSLRQEFLFTHLFSHEETGPGQS
jgi:deoxyribodipyrimidine photo-lyase